MGLVLGSGLGSGPVGLPVPGSVARLGQGSAAAVATPPGPGLARPELARPVSGRFLPRLASLPAPLALTLLVVAPTRVLAQPAPTVRLRPVPTARPQPVRVLGPATHANVTCARRSPRACRCRPTVTISLMIWCPGSALTASNAARMRKWSSYAKP